jgi:hypothetical protein
LLRNRTNIPSFRRHPPRKQRFSIKTGFTDLSWHSGLLGAFCQAAVQALDSVFMPELADVGCSNTPASMPKMDNPRLGLPVITVQLAHPNVCARDFAQ